MYLICHSVLKVGLHVLSISYDEGQYLGHPKASLAFVNTSTEAKYLGSPPVSRASIKINLVQNRRAPVTVGFLVAENSCSCISKFDVTEKNAVGVANTKLQLHLLKYSITGAPIRFYKSQIMKLVRSHFCYNVCSKYGGKHKRPARSSQTAPLIGQKGSVWNSVPTR